MEGFLQSVTHIWHGVGSLLCWCKTFGYATLLFYGVHYCKKAMRELIIVTCELNYFGGEEKEQEATPLAASLIPSPRDTEST